MGNAKFFSLILSIVIVVAGAIYFLEDHFFTVVDAQQMKTQIEKESVQTFKVFQQQMQQQQLENVKDKKVIIDKELKRSPEDTYLNIRSEELDREQKRLEEQLRK
uniref:Uncharacterized protein n=1 Tax=viral metagenome TaxID=1070528 RepID=A0A6M3KB85_9ZZZZ